MDLLRRASTRIVAAAAATAVSLLVPLAATAQGQAAPAQTETQGRTPATAVSEQKLDQAAAALKDVTTVRESYLQKVEAAPPAEKQRLTEEANQALTKTVTDKGLTVEEYNTILQLAQNDQALRQQLVKRLQPKPQ